MTHSYRLSFLALFTGLFWLTPQVQADDIIRGVDQMNGYAAGMIGASIPTNSNVTPTASIGAAFGYKFNPFFGGEIFASYFGQKSSGPYLGLPSATEMSLTIVTIQLKAYFGNLHFGAEVGTALRSWNGVASTIIGGTATSSTTFIGGLNLGYDYMLSRNLSIGAEGHYYFPGAASEANVGQAFLVARIWL